MATLKLIGEESEPKNVKALLGTNKDHCKKVMDEEIESLRKNNMRFLAQFPEGRHIITFK